MSDLPERTTGDQELVFHTLGPFGLARPKQGCTGQTYLMQRRRGSPASQSTNIRKTLCLSLVLQGTPDRKKGLMDE